MLYIVYCIAIIHFVSLVLAEHAKKYTNCVHGGTIAVHKTPLLHRRCLSATQGAICCAEIADCNAFSYNYLSEVCVFYRSINCQLNGENGKTTFTNVTGFVYCLSGWIMLGNSCYFYENTRKLDWDDAMEYCTSQGGYLGEITDEAEFQLIDSLITGDVFIGCRLNNGNWQWITSGRELLLNDTLWTPVEPQTHESECVQIWKGKKLDDFSCHELLNFLCEKAVLFL
ncbi:perlucin-like protein [Mytilus edulis]|uniref:perlucin-like protein n=1 Tax=Mytilus edulis TaxID=6550 RepID=UPI0039F0BB35